jgi:CBS domain-containing protein
MAGQSNQTDLRSILTSVKVGDLASTTVPTLKPANTIAEAAAEMWNQSHGSAVICAAGELVGIFTERDLLQAIGEGLSMETPLAEVMSADLRTVSTGDSLFDAIRWMDQGGYRRLPVVDASGAPAGIVDVKAITHFLVELFPAGVYNQASHAQSIAKNREGA